MGKRRHAEVLEMTMTKSQTEEQRRLRAARNARYAATHKEQKRVRNAEYYVANKHEISAQHSTYNRTHSEMTQSKAALYRLNNPEKFAARMAVWDEVRSHRWPPPSFQVCEICGEAQAQQYHHHNGYGPGHEIDVIAVCKECHAAEHRKAKHVPTQRQTEVAGVS